MFCVRVFPLYFYKGAGLLEFVIAFVIIVVTEIIVSACCVICKPSIDSEVKLTAKHHTERHKKNLRNNKKKYE